MTVCWGCVKGWPTRSLPTEGGPVVVHVLPEVLRGTYRDAEFSQCASGLRACPLCLRTDCPTYEGAL